MEKSEMYPESDRTEDKQLLGESADIQLIDSIGVAWFGSKMDTKIRFHIGYKKITMSDIKIFFNFSNFTWYDAKIELQHFFWPEKYICK